VCPSFSIRYHRRRHRRRRHRRRDGKAREEEEPSPLAKGILARE